MRRTLGQVINRRFSQGTAINRTKTESATCPFQATATVSNSNSVSSDNNASRSKLLPESETNLEDAKPYSEMPSPPGLPFIGTVPEYIWNGGGKYLHEYVNKRHAELGPIYK